MSDYTIQFTPDGKFNCWGSSIESSNYRGIWRLEEDLLILIGTNSAGEEDGSRSTFRYIYNENVMESKLVFLKEGEREIISLVWLEDGTTFYLRYVEKKQ